jgi:hypothetical protein
MGPAQGLGARLGHAEVLDLALGDQIPHRAGNILDRDGGIDAVLIALAIIAVGTGTRSPAPRFWSA